jgi:hypothetical protein
VALALAEFALLDPVNAFAVSRALFGAEDPGSVQSLRDAMAAPVPVSGTVPDMDLGLWTPPWLPLFLEWEVRWYPIPYRKDEAPLWAFDGSGFDRTGADVPQPEGTLLSGRAILTPKPGFDFRARMEQFAGTHPEIRGLDTLDEFIQHTDGWDFLSQTLTGLHEQIALRNPRANLAPDPVTPIPSLGMTMAQLVGDGRHSVPLSLKAAKQRFVDPTSSFEGMRNGQFVFTRLAVVDRFGQTVQVVTTQTSPQFTPVLAPGLAPSRPLVAPAAGTAVQLPPRLLQPARLDLALLTPEGDAPVAEAAASTPVAGWLVANHLDGALAAYDAAGAILGELRPAADATGHVAPRWERAPGTSAPASLDALRALHPRLGGVLAGLAVAGAEALAGFLEAVDETSWAVDPLGERSDLLLNALVGRPLAVVRAGVSLRLQGEPVTDPSWPFTFAPVKAPFTGYTFEVELGDAESRRDGLMGYWGDGA